MSVDPIETRAYTMKMKRDHVGNKRRNPVRNKRDAMTDKQKSCAEYTTITRGISGNPLWNKGDSH